MAGIVSYGFYIPRYRIKVDDIADVWGKNSSHVKGSLGLTEKSIAGRDEDSLTMAYESASLALRKVDLHNNDLKVIFFGSETHPYVVNPSSTILGEFLGIDHNYLAYDTQFACKAATGALISAESLVRTEFSKYALVVASDKANAKPHGALEYTAGSGSVSLLVGDKDIAVEMVDFSSYSSDTPDFWRREGIRFPSHSGRFTGKPSYFQHIFQAAKNLLKKQKLEAKDFKYAVFHMPNGRFPLEIGASLGFSREQIEKSLVVNYLGNCYSASALMGLVSVLDVAKGGELIFLASYGSGAGSDAFIFKVTKNIDKVRENFSARVSVKDYINYTTYLKFTRII